MLVKLKQYEISGRFGIPSVTDATEVITPGKVLEQLLPVMQVEEK